LDASLEKTEAQEELPLATAQSEPAEAATKNWRLPTSLFGMVVLLDGFVSVV